MLDAIIAILAGALLLSHLWMRGDAGRGVLGPLSLIVGLIALILGLMGITNVVGVALFLGGMILVLDGLRGMGRGVPAQAGVLASGEGDRLSTIIGALLLVMGVVILIRVSDDRYGRDNRWRWRGSMDSSPSVLVATAGHTL